MKKTLYIAAALLALAGCKEKTTQETPEIDKISIAPETATFSKDGGVQEVIVTSSGEWTLTTEETYDWISANVSTGVDGDVVSFEAKENYTGEELTAVYTFKCGKAETKFTAISRSGEATFLELTSAEEVELTSAASQVEVLFSTNLNYRSLKAEIPADAAWITHKVSLEGENNVVKMYFDVAANESAEARTATVSVSGGEGVEPVSFTVKQRPTPYITPEKAEYVIYPEGGSIAFPVESNVEYEVSVKADEGDEWLKYEGSKEGLETFSADASDVKRYATVTFTEKSPVEGVDPITATVKVRQTPKPIITKALNFTDARAYPAVWGESTKTALTNMSYFTLEALVNADDFKTSGSLSTIMGIEGKFLVRVGDSGIPSNRLQIASSSNLTDPKATLETGKWYHIAVTFERGHVLTYLNGEKVIDGYCGTASVNFGVDHNDEVDYSGWGSVTRCFWVGYAYDHNRDFRGRMSELRIWNKVLSEEEINAENHFYQVDPESEGLLCYWKLDEGEGTTFKDYTGNGNDLSGEVNIREEGKAQVGDPGANWVDVSLPE